MRRERKSAETKIKQKKMQLFRETKISAEMYYEKGAGVLRLRVQEIKKKQS